MKNIYLKLTMMALFWAGGFISGKVLVEYAGPFTIAFLRFLISTVILGILVRGREKWPRMSRALFVYGVVTGLIGVFFYNYFFFAGIKLVDAGRSSVIMSTVPIVVALISFFLMKEKFSTFKLFGIVLSMFGAWIVVTKGEIDLVMNGSFGRGELYLILGVLCAAAFTLLSKQMLYVLSPMMTMLYISIYGTIFLTGPAVLEMVHQPPVVSSMSFWGNLLYLAIGPSVIAVVWYYEAISKIGPSKASQYMNLMPVFAVGLANVFLGEQITTSLIVGGGLVIAGLYMSGLSAERLIRPKYVGQTGSLRSKAA